MSRTLRKAAVVVGAVALVVATAGALAPAATAAFLGSAGLTAGTLLGTTALAAGLSAGAAVLSFAAQMTAKKPSGATATGNPERFTASKDAGIPYVIGRTATAGNLIHRQTFDHNGSKPANAYQTLFGVWSGGGPIEAIEAFQVDGATVNFALNPVAPSVPDEAAGGFHDYMWLRTQTGATPEQAALVATGFHLYPAGWSATSKLSGYAAFAWTLRFDDKGKVYPSGVPQPRAILKGVRVYDPRKDSTYPGGSGTHRATDAATWTWSDNPWLHALAWALGRYQNGKRVLGIGMALAAIDVPALVEAANIADVNGWTAGGVVFSTDGKYDVLKKMMAAGGGEPLPLGGMLSCTISTPRVPLATITTADIIGRASVTATQGSRDRINGVIPTYRSEAHDWSLVPASLVRVATYLAEDGKPRTRGLTWELVQDKDQVAELAAYEIANSREFGPIVTPLKLKWAGYKPGDCLHIASPELGMDSQDVLITKRHFDPETGAVTLTSKSETYDKHAFCLGKTGTAPPTPSLQVVDRGLLPTPGYDATWAGTVDTDGQSLTDFAGVVSGGLVSAQLLVANAEEQANAALTLTNEKPDLATVASMINAIEAFDPGGNLVDNSDFSAGTAGWQLVAPAPAAYGTDLIVEFGQPIGLHYLGMGQNSADPAAGGALVSKWMACAPGSWVQASGRLATFACTADIVIQWGNGGGDYLRDGAASASVDQVGSVNFDTWPLVWAKDQVPADARFFRLTARKSPTRAGNNNSVIGLLQPMAALASAKQTVPSNYRPSSAGAGLVTTRASVTEAKEAAAGANGAVANLRTELVADYGDLSNRLSITAGVANRADGRSAIAFEVVGTDAGNTTRLALTSLNGVSNFLVRAGTIAFDGNVVIDGTLTTSKAINNAFTIMGGAGNPSEIGGQGNSGGGSYYDPDTGQYVQTADQALFIVSYTVVLSAPGDISVDVSAAQGYYGSQPSWRGYITMNGTPIASRGGNAYADQISIGAIRLGLPAGSYTFAFMWAGGSNGVRVRESVIRTIARMK